MKTSHELHDRCIAARRAIKLIDPDLTSLATNRGTGVKIGTPEHALMLDLRALDAVASSFATGFAASKPERTRALAILSARAAGP